MTDGRQRIGVQTDYRGHTPRVLFTRLLHEAATLPDQLQPGWEIHHSGGDERGELTERVTGDHGWVDLVPGFGKSLPERFQCRDADGEDRRLRIDGVFELVRRTVKAEPGEGNPRTSSAWSNTRRAAAEAS